EAGRIAGRSGEAGDEAELDRVFGSNECDWYRLSRSFGGHGRYAPGCSDHADLPTSQVGGQFREPIESARQPIVNRHVLAFDPAAFGKATAERMQYMFARSRCQRAEKPHHGHRRLLRARRQRPRSRAAEQRYERAALHSITSSASESRLSEILMPSALAVFKLITVSNLVGCNTGSSEGFAPLRIRAV